jgi:hypothetical protein
VYAAGPVVTLNFLLGHSGASIALRLYDLLKTKFDDAVTVDIEVWKPHVVFTVTPQGRSRCRKPGGNFPGGSVALTVSGASRGD